MKAFLYSFLLVTLWWSCTAPKNEKDEFPLYPPASKLIKAKWKEMKFCNWNISVSSPAELRKEQFPPLDSLNNKIASIDRYIFQTEDNFLVQVICASYKDEFVDGDMTLQSISNPLVNSLENSIHNKDLKFNKQQIYIQNMPALIVRTLNDHGLNDDGMIILVLYEDFKMWQLQIVYDFGNKIHEELADQIIQSVK